ncbi:MAG: peptide-methionine (S)-S-oxide reductase MsrA [Candidatus Omnitrophica bacterium]|nr:peptide-methionine (S)-S-oxide reductase MsrA [Candidatus Omnitrophota bacterium]
MRSPSTRPFILSLSKENGRLRTGLSAAALLILLTGSLQSEGRQQIEPKLQKAAFGAGCFWGVEKIFSKLDGVVSTSVGYMGGTTKAATYPQVCSGQTGHAEAVQLVYDPSRVSYEDLLVTFWETHDPTTPDRQGPDVGSQYRSVIFVYDGQQEEAAKRSKRILDEAKVFKDPIVTQIIPATEFYRAEEYHQKYLEKNPNGYCSHHLQSPKIRQALQTKSAGARS